MEFVWRCRGCTFHIKYVWHIYISKRFIDTQVRNMILTNLSYVFFSTFISKTNTKILLKKTKQNSKIIFDKNKQKTIQKLYKNYSSTQQILYIKLHQPEKHTQTKHSTDKSMTKHTNYSSNLRHQSPIWTKNCLSSPATYFRFGSEWFDWEVFCIANSFACRACRQSRTSTSTR